MTPHFSIRKQEFAAQLFIFFMLIFVSGGDAQIPFPPMEEVNALREIADQLGKRDWDFNLNPCNNNTNWVSPARPDLTLYNNTVLCANCTIDECHVTHIILKGQDLAGVLPPSLAKLPYIRYIDLGWNYLNGTIPREWAFTKLQFLAVGINRLSGPIPEDLGNISTLVYMSLENNMFSGLVPTSLGSLTNLEHLILSTNNLIGGLSMLSQLTKLTELRLSSNKFVGELPIFETWTSLQKLEIQGSGFDGPIPDSISFLANLTDLRISDLNGDSLFPKLGNLVGMQRLILRSNKMNGMIPKYIFSNMTRLQFLDLSFNKLYGEIPDLENLNALEYVVLTSNDFNGEIPNWIQNPSSGRVVVDLSYNDLSKSSLHTPCRETLNLYRSFNGRSSLEPSICLTTCTQDRNSFHINCAGKDVTIGNTKYEADEASEGFGKFIHINQYWGSSNTGHFWDANNGRDEATTRNNISVLQMDGAELYMTARVSPLSLTYYGRCLANGVYIVKLHFAEITFTNNQSFRSLGRRIFDVYVQDKLMLKDFNIEDEAVGVNKAMTKEFVAVVETKTLDIRFQWAGLGTTAVPLRGNYGPLISAISVKSDVNKRKKMLIVAAAAAASSCLVFIFMFILWWKGCFGRRNSRQQDLRALDLQTGLFTLKQIEAATENFNAENKIGEGGFGSVYKGVLLDGTIIAVKQLSSTSKQGNREFVNEVGMISGLQHPNLVKLYGCCIEGRQLILVYEYLENNCLGRSLFGTEQSQLKLDWQTRQKICLGIARGLAFLHEESALKIVHRDIKATNVLLDGELNPKISDFGLAKLHEEENTHISTRIAGTIGYMAPEYALWGRLTYKADVYSFGVVAMEIVAGKSNMNYQSDGDYLCLLDKARAVQQEGNLLELVDPKLDINYNIEEAMRMIKVALLCTNTSPAPRPTMSEVVSMLEGEISVQKPHVDPSIYGDELDFESLGDTFDELQLRNSSDTKSLVHSAEVAYDGSSSTSTKDLYSVSLYSQ